ncbi:MAG: 23S rRNA (guanosine(2251)-2'-O)-methyltransferase RlmB [Leptospiraceae bacterium]|nr:23S rRNA (guanosine(2251)-2'-O)-methyltransferase RlmB [Leptospiraceae bacterium]
MEKNLKQKSFIYGKQNVKEFFRKLKSSNSNEKVSIREILVKKNPSKDIEKEILSFIPKGFHITYISTEEFDSLFPNSNHQGIAVVQDTKKEFSNSLDFSDLKKDITEKKGPILILDRIQDPGNLGNILRTAECFGVQFVIIPERESCDITNAVEKVSSGATHYLKIYKVTNLKQVIEVLKEKGYWVVAGTEKGESSPKNLPSKEETCLILGNENEGIKKILLEHSDFTYRINLHGKIESLNVGVSCGILLDRIVNRI